MKKSKRPNRQKGKLGLPDLEHVKSPVLVGLRSPESQRSYRRSIDDFVRWYCSEPRLSFSKTVVTRYRIHLEERLLAPGTINVRLAAVRRLAYEAADTGLLSPDLAAGIRRVKGPGAPSSGFEGGLLGFSFFLFIPVGDRFPQVPPHFSRRSTNCSTASLPDASPIRASPGCGACTPVFRVSSEWCTR